MQSNIIALKNGNQIHFYSAGIKNNMPLILLHGWPTNALLWRHIVPELSKYFYVLCPDLPGHGASSGLNGAYDKDALGHFVFTFYQTLGLKKAHLACHDLGGVAGFSFAVKHPDLIDKLIVMNTTAYADWHWKLKLSIFLLKQPFLARFYLFPLIFKQIFKTGIANHDIITDELIEKYRAPWSVSKETKAAFSKTIEPPPEQLVLSREQLNGIKLPTLLLWGTKDKYFPFKTARRLQSDIPGSKLVKVKKASHFLQEEQPEFIWKQILAFLL